MLWRGTWLLCFALHIFAGFTLVSSGSNFYLGFAVLVVCGLLTTIFHELGHAVGAWCVKWRVVVFAVHRAAWHAHNHELAWLPRDALKEAAGYVLAVPSSNDTNTCFRACVMIAGGPLFSLIQAIVAIMVVVTTMSGTKVGAVDVEAVAAGLAAQGLAAFLGTVVPHRDPRSNDGQLLKEAIVANRLGRSPTSLAWMQTLFSYKVRLKDVPPWMLEVSNADVDPDGNLARWLATIRIGQTLDRSPVDAALARSQIDEFREKYGTDNWLMACDAFLAATNERNLERASTMIEQFGDPEIPQLEAAARAATFKLAGNDKIATEWLDRMDEIIASTSPFRDLTFRDIRARVEAIQPMQGSHLASRPLAASP